MKGEEVEERASSRDRAGTPQDKEGEGLLLPSLVHGTAAPAAPLHSSGRGGHNELHLPHIVPPGSSGHGSETPSLLPAPETEPSTSPGDQEEAEDGQLSLSHLPQIKIPDSSSSEEEREEGEGEEEKGEGDVGSSADESEPPPPYPDLQAQQISWPAVLQYLRESDSLASQYFSLDRQGDSGLSRGAAVEEAVRRTATPVIGGVDSVCPFCARPPPQWSVLECATGEAAVRRMNS